MKAIVAVVVVLSENRAEDLVRSVYRGDGRGDSRDAPAASSAAPRGYSPSEDGPSGPVSRRGVDDLRFGGNRTNIKNILGNGNHPRPRTPTPVNDQNHASAASAVSKYFHMS